MHAYKICNDKSQIDLKTKNTITIIITISIGTVTRWLKKKLVNSDLIHVQTSTLFLNYGRNYLLI